MVKVFQCSFTLLLIDSILTVFLVHIFFLRDTLATLCLETVPASLKVLILLWNFLITFNYAYIIYLSFKSLSLISRVPLPVTA